MAKGPTFPDFSNDASAAAIAAEVLSALFGDVQTHAPSAVAGDDDEAVHGMRVALRRLRTLFDAFASSMRRKPFARMRKDLRSLSRVLGALRDADVHLASLRTFRTGSTVREGPGIEWLSARIREERAAAVAALHAAYTEFNRSFDGAFGSAVREKSAPLGAGLQRLIKKGVRKHVRQGERGFARGDQKRLHQFRISGKRLRYIVEVFGPTIGERSNEAYKLLSDMQDDLGQINDANTFIALYTGLIEAMAPGDDRRFGLYALITARTEGRHRALACARARWESEGTGTYGAALCESLGVDAACTTMRKSKARSNKSALKRAPASS